MTAIDELIERAERGEITGNGIVQMRLLVDQKRFAEDRARKLGNAIRAAILLSDTGSESHRKAFDPDGVGEIPTGWRVVEKMREALLEVIG